MKNVVAYSLWGDSPKYWNGAIRNIEAVSEMLPNFVTRFYIDSSCPKSRIDEISKYNTEIFIVDPETSWHGMFWRFYAACDPDVDIFLSRDTDSRISNREVNALNQWLNSDKDFHIMRDHPYHRVPILGGMWGCRRGILSNINNLIETWVNHTSNKGRWKEVFVAGDQNFLAEVVYPIVYKNAFEHSEFGIRYVNLTHSFPTVREDFEFVGDSFDENDVRHPDYWKLIKNKI